MLTPKQKRFADEYLIDLNATAAYKRAGYIASGNAAEVNASRLLSNAKVQLYMAERMKAREVRTEITQDRVLAEYAKLAFLDPRRFYDDAGQLISVNLLPADVAAALVGVDVTEAYDKESNSAITTKKVKFADKKGALDSVARHLGMFVDRSEVKVTTHEASLDDLA